MTGALRSLLSSDRPSCRVRVTGLLGTGGGAQVYAVEIDGVPHIVKVFDGRRSLSRVLENYRRSGRSHRVVLASDADDNPLRHDLMLLRVPPARVLHPSDLASRRVRLGLVERLLSVYRHHTGGVVSPDVLRRMLEEAAPGALSAVARVVPELRQQFEDAVRSTARFLARGPELLAAPERLLHNDLWWANIVVTPDERVYLIDWESVGEGDYLADLAQLRVMFHRDGPEHAFGPAIQVDFLAEDFLSELIERISRVLRDTTARRRFAFYLTYKSIRRLALYDHDELSGEDQGFVRYLADAVGTRGRGGRSRD